MLRSVPQSAYGTPAFPRRILCPVRWVGGLAAVVLSSAALGACAGLAGIDAFSKGSCNGGDCDGGVDDSSLSGDGPGLEGGNGTDSGSGGADGTADVSSGEDSGSDAHPPGQDAAHDGSGVAESGSDCGPLDTTANCSACGAACDAKHSTGATCTGTTCQYTGCSSGYADCDKTAPDTNGCECATPGCCSTQCQTVHSNGVGQSFYDCNPMGTHTLATAIEACVAYAQTVGGNANDCVGGWDCPQGNPSNVAVCYSAQGGMVVCSNYCWTYIGATTGDVQGCNDPCSQSLGPWN